MDENKDIIDNSIETSEPEEKVMTPEDYKVVMNLIKETEESCKTLKESIYSSIRDMGYHSDILNDMLPYKKEDIETMDDDKIKSFLSEYVISDEKEINPEDMMKIKEFSIILLQTQYDTEKAKSETYNVLKDYFNYLSSDKVRKSRMERIESLKTAVESESDPTRKAKMKKMISTMESSLSYSFLQDRFNTYGDKEIENIKDGFFRESKGSYIVNKYASKMSKFGFESKVYQKFFNIEEDFLSESYSPFNNLFLYVFMRFVAYSDPYNENDKMFVQSITSAMANLIYHKFESIESEQYFLHVITEVLDKFKDYEEFFKENNTTYANHPARIESQREHDKNRREALIKALNKMNVTDFDDSTSLDDLQELYNKKSEELILEQINVDSTKTDDISEESEESEENIIKPFTILEDEDKVESEEVVESSDEIESDVKVEDVDFVSI